MCGITGWIDWQRNLIDCANIVEQMRDQLIARGPDASGIWLSANCAFGHRRLSVMDPENGSQPMVYQDGESTFVICYNGELYNAPSLRTVLADKGYRFITKCDTEVLLYACIEWGKDALDRLNGIFAFAFWDERNQSCLLVRDRLGVKPLFYAHVETGLLFGSEPKALLAHPDIVPEVTLEGMTEVLALGPARTPGHGIFRQINELRPGYWLEITPNGVHIHRYWQLQAKPHEDNFETTTAKIRQLLTSATHRQLAADVPLCALLSGGLDSSALTALAVNSDAFTNQSMSTFSVDYEQQNEHFEQHIFQPESDGVYIQSMSTWLQTQHNNVLLTNDQLLDTLNDVVTARDMPGMADIDASLLLFCRAIRRQATVAISGEAADEVFGGYPWFHNPSQWHSRRFPWSTSVDFRTRMIARERAMDMNIEAYVARRYIEAIAAVPTLPSNGPKEPATEQHLRQLSYLNITRFMPTLLDRKDRMSMACGLEVRVPFCDHELVEYAFNIPWEMKNYAGREKGILRASLDGILPSDVLWRKKSPYPKTHHPNYTKRVSETLLEIMADSSSPLRDWIDIDKVRLMAQ
jgi:asparagine synthase (glutamine-hydrolysing)